MTYTTFKTYGKEFDLTHLNPSKMALDIDGVSYTINIEFGCHCFTDEKETGPLFRKNKGEIRFWSDERYSDSFMLPDLIKKVLLDRSCYTIPFKSKKSKGEQYYYLYDSFYAVFFYINNVNVESRTFKVYIISAYNCTNYNGSLPKGTSYKLSWILSKRVKGEFIL